MKKTFGNELVGDIKCAPSAYSLRRGRVVAFDGHGVWIDLDVEATCGACKTQSICAERGTRRQFVALTEGHHFVCGSEIVVEVAGGSLSRAVGLAYGVPLLACISLTALMTFLFPADEFAAIAGAICGLAIGFGILRIAGRKQTAPILRVMSQHRSG